MKHAYQRGFSIVEVLVVIAVIGILAGIVLVALNTTRTRARDAIRKQDVRSIMTLLEAYRVTHGRYPISRDCQLGAAGPNLPSPNTQWCSSLGGNPALSWAQTEWIRDNPTAAQDPTGPHPLSTVTAVIPSDPRNTAVTAAPNGWAGGSNGDNLTYNYISQTGAEYILVVRLENVDSSVTDTKTNYVGVCYQYRPSDDDTITRGDEERTGPCPW